MSAIRRYVRVIAMAWLLCQAASLAAFVPEHCCDKHAVTSEAEQEQSHEHHAATPTPAAPEKCHEAPAAEPEEGDVCPMHQGTQSRGHECCAFTNTCDGPGTHLASLLAFIGVPEVPHASGVILAGEATFVPPVPPPLVRVSTPDSPPPKR